MKKKKKKKRMNQKGNKIFQKHKYADVQSLTIMGKLQ